MALFENLHRTLGRHQTLKILCRCGHRAEWTQAQAFARLGSDATPADVRRKLLCGRCGRTADVQLWI